MEPFLGGVIVMFILLLLTFTVGNYILSTAGPAFGYGGLRSMAEFLGIPSDTGTWPNALWFIIMPTMATLAIIYGFLEELRIFRHAENATLIYTIIGIAWAGILMYTGALKVLAIFFYQVGALVAAIVFTTVFIIGAVLWGIFRSRGMVGELRAEYGSLRPKGMIEGALRQIKDQIRALEKFGDLSKLSTNQLTAYNELKAKTQNLIQRLDVDLRSDMNKKELEELEKLKNEFSKFR
jgi:hypothetical protein